MSVPVVKPKKLTPALPQQQRPYRDFDDYAAAGKRVDRLFNKLWEGIGDIEDQDRRLTVEELEQYTHLGSRLDAALHEFRAGYRVFEHEELYQETKTSKPNLLGHNTPFQIRRQVAGDKIGFLIGSFPNAGPHNPEIYVAALIEEVAAANPSASALEATCRHIRRTATFAPAVPEVLKVLREQQTLWDDLLQHARLGDDGSSWCSRLEKLARPKVLIATTVMRGRARVLLTEVHYQKEAYFNDET
jgi:hypothetical protein